MKHEVTLSSLLQIHNMVAVLEVISSLEKYPITKEALEVCHPLNMVFYVYTRTFSCLSSFHRSFSGNNRWIAKDSQLRYYFVPLVLFPTSRRTQDPFWAQISILGSTVPVCAGHYINHHSPLMNSVALSNITLQFWSPL